MPNLRSREDLMVEWIMNEYENISTQMMAHDAFRLDYVPPHIPSYFDMVNVLIDADLETINQSIGYIATKYHIFFRMPDGYRNIPIVEVW